MYEGGSKPSSSFLLHSMRPSALSYARRPSGTNNRTTVPHLHRRTSSGSSSGHVPEGARSAPLHSHSSTEDDELYSDFGFSSRDEDDHNEPDHAPSKQDREKFYHNNKATITNAKRKSNRASLPAYFSLLQMGSPSQPRSSPISSSSGNTVTRVSPPTPRLTFAVGGNLPHPSTAPPTPSVHATPRGRRRVPGDSRSSRRSGHSESHSRSPHRRAPAPAAAALLPRAVMASATETRQGNKGSVEQIFDWLSIPPPVRGRPAVRRNSSPPPKMMLSAIALDTHNRTFGDESESGSRARTRGRFRAEDLHGPVGGVPEAPGYGYGRSGLLDREKYAGSRGTTALG